LVIFPLTFASSAFVPPESMPAAVEAFANANPISTIVDAVRALFVNAPAGNDVWVSVLWCVALTAVFSTLSVHRYRRAVSS
jgi:ABC-type multidrug transport system permease subunit